jgi:hypothetical protein
MREGTARPSDLRYPLRVRFVPPLKVVLVLLIVGSLFVFSGLRLLFDDFKPALVGQSLRLVLCSSHSAWSACDATTNDEIAGDFSAKDDIRRTAWERKTKL